MKEQRLVQQALDRLAGRTPSDPGPGPKTSADWLGHWRELAQVTYGITADDPRYEPVMRWLNVCDASFQLDSWGNFKEAAEEVKRIAGQKNITTRRSP
jgi:hypothetical protein